MSNFHEVRFPASLSFASTGGPERRTQIITLASGAEERNTPWAHARRRYDAGVGLRSLDDLQEIIAFFEARRGQLFGFRWKDFSDFKSCAPGQVPAMDDQQIGLGDGVNTTFALSKTYETGAYAYARPITKPVAGSVLIAKDGVLLSEGADYTLDTTTGQCTLTQPPASGAVITAGFAFDVPVRFDTPQLSVRLDAFQAGAIPAVPVVEVRV